MPKVPTIVFTANLLLREGLLHFLARTRYQVIAKPRSASDFVSIPKKSPMLLIIGSDGNSANAADVISSLSPNLSCARIVVLSTNGDPEVCRAAIRAGAVAYLSSSMDRDAFIKALDLVMACGVTILSEEAVRTTTPFENKTMVTLRPTKHGDEERVANSSPLAALAEGNESPITDRRFVRLLSPREREIIKCMARGDSNKLIARCSDITEATVKAHVKTILRKLGAHNRTQVAILATRNQRPVQEEEQAMAPRNSKASAAQ